MLYEFLENYSITIPEYGEIKCPKNQRPIVFLTSNNYRELSGALKRRCNFLYIKEKTVDEIIDILKLKVGVDDKLANGIAKCIIKINKKTNIKQKPSISEAINWAMFLKEQEELTKDDVVNSLSIIAKNYKDYNDIKNIILNLDEGDKIW